MCGIAGYFSSESGFGTETLRAMTNAIVHRGPDSDGLFTEGKVGLGFRRLSIIDLSMAANQPMVSHDEKYIIAFNGEIYNYQEIATRYNMRLQTHSDTEVLLESFAQKGIAAIQDWNGMFAIAIYDRKEEKLYLIRDRVGVKPLYYFAHNQTIFFASEMKALYAVPYVRTNLTINKKAIRTFLNVGYIPGPATISNEISKLPSGHYAVIGNNSFEVNAYWKPEDKIYPTTITDEATAKNELHRLMKTSVEYRMISDVPYGTFLSGGVDSSLVTALAQSISTQPIKTFSIAFKDGQYDESKYARAVSDHLHTDHHEFIVTEADALGLVEKMMDVYDEPYAESSGIPTMLVSKLAKQNVTMVLTGDGGDELFMGYGAYTWANRLNNPFVKAFRHPISSVLYTMGGRYRRASGLFNYRSDSEIKQNIFSQEQSYFSENELDKLLADKTGIELSFEEEKGLARKLTPAEEQSLFDLKYYLRDTLLTKVDIASMQYSLEARTPFLDYRVVEFALNLDESLKVKNGTAKYLLKQLLYDYLPKEIFDRPKWGFAIPMKKWLGRELKFLSDKYLDEEVLEKYGIVSVPEARKFLQRFMNGEDYLWNRIWALISLHRWLEKNSYVWNNNNNVKAKTILAE